MATYYWVGGAGTWSAASNTQFAITSGGAPTILNPTSVDVVNFDANSGSGTVSVTAGATAAAVTLNTTNITVSLSANITTTDTFNLAAGTLTLNSYIFTILKFSSTSASVRTLNFGTGSITCTANATTVWGTYNATAAMIITGTPTVNFNYAGATGTRNITNWGSPINVNITAGSDAVNFGDGGYSYQNINFTGFSGTWANSSMSGFYGNLIVSTGMTVASGTGPLICVGTSGTQQITTANKTLDFPVTINGAGGSVQLQDACTIGSTRTLTLTAGTLDISLAALSVGFISTTNSNTRAIAFGTNKITLTGNNGTIFNSSIANNMTFTGTPLFDCNYAGATGTRTLNYAATSGVYLANLPSVNVTAGTDILTLGASSNWLNINGTGFTGQFGGAFNCYGNLTLGTGSTVYGGGVAISFVGTSGNQLITTNSVTINRPIIFNGIGGTFAFQDTLTQDPTRAFTITNGTVKLKSGTTNTVGSVVTSGTNQKFLQSTTPGSTATLSQASGTVDASYLNIKDNTATGGATFNAYVDQGNIDAGNVDGWNFGISPIVGGAEYTYALRSLTEQRRF
jgi:hypothetical protein